MATKAYNNYSPELLERFPKVEPKTGKKLMFQVLGIRFDPIMKRNIIPQTSQFNAIDRIWDPWQRDPVTKEYIGAYIDIAFIIGERPTAPESTRETNVMLGEIVFRRELFGAIEYDGDRNMEQMARFLFFSNLNESNSSDKENPGKAMPWHIKPNSGYIYKLIRPDEMAKSKLGGDRLVDRAKLFIDELDDTRLEEISKGLFPSEYLHKSKDETILKLRSIAERNPEKILNLSKDIDVQVNAFVNTCIEKGLIEFVNPSWIWVDDKKPFCNVKPGQTQFSSIKMFFLTEAGIGVMSLLEELLGKKSAPSPEIEVAVKEKKLSKKAETV